MDYIHEWIILDVQNEHELEHKTYFRNYCSRKSKIRFFKPMDNKPATKGALKKITKQILGHYHPIINMPQRFDGALPYFDRDTNEAVYLL